MTDKEAFKVAMLAHCASLGMTIDETTAYVKHALLLGQVSLEKQAAPRELTERDRRDIDAGKSQWFPRTSSAAPIAQYMRNPNIDTVLGSLIGALGGGLIGSGSGYAVDNPGLGTGIGAGVGGVGGGLLGRYLSNHWNNRLEDAMTYLPEGARGADFLHHPNIRRNMPALVDMATVNAALPWVVNSKYLKEKESAEQQRVNKQADISEWIPGYDFLKGTADKVIGTGLDLSSSAIKTLGSLGLVSAFAAPLSAGALGGYGLAKFTNLGDEDLEDVRVRRRIEELRIAAAQASQRRQAQQRKQTTPQRGRTVT